MGLVLLVFQTSMAVFQSGRDVSSPVTTLIQPRPPLIEQLREPIPRRSTLKSLRTVSTIDNLVLLRERMESPDERHITSPVSLINQRTLWFAGLIVAGTMVFLLFRSSRHEVSSRGGKTLHEWAEELRIVRANFDGSQERAKRQEVAEAAIRAIGTNALQFAWEDVSAQATRREHLLRWLAARVPSLKIAPPKVEDRWVRGSFTLEVLGPLAKPLLPGLAILASNQTGYAESALLAVGPDALPSLTNLLVSSRYPKTGNLIGALANAVYLNRITPEQAAVTLPFLVNVWRSSDHHARWYAAGAFGAIHQDAGLCVPLLLEGFSDPMQSVRESSIRSLGCFGDAASAHAGKLADAYENADAFTKGAICGALASFKTAREISIPVLIRALQYTNEVVAMNAAQSLGQIRSMPALTLPALGKAAQDSRTIVRLMAVQSIGFFRSEANNEIPVLEEACTDPDVRVRNAATNALRWILQP